MVLLIIIPIKWLFHWEYTQHFQTNPCCLTILRGKRKHLGDNPFFRLGVRWYKQPTDTKQTSYTGKRKKTQQKVRVPSGELTFCHGKIHHFSWENPRIKWPFSIAMLVHHRVNHQFSSWENVSRVEPENAKLLLRGPFQQCLLLTRRIG